MNFAPADAREVNGIGYGAFAPGGAIGGHNDLFKRTVLEHLSLAFVGNQIHFQYITAICKSSLGSQNVLADTRSHPPAPFPPGAVYSRQQRRQQRLGLWVS